MRFILLNHDRELPILDNTARFFLIMLDDHSKKGNLLKIAAKMTRYIGNLSLMENRRLFGANPHFHQKFF